MRVLVLGASVSGAAAIRLAGRQGDVVRVYDQDAARVAAFRDDGLDVVAGDPAAPMYEGIDAVVASPGVPEHGAAIQLALAAGLPVLSELEYAARSTLEPIVAITGTNGKTTTTNAAASMLVASGVSARPVGNVGYAMSDAVADPGVLVAEASSFQLRFIDTLHPVAATILNVSPDHLDWHGTMDAYLAAKARITENQTADDILVIDPSATDIVAAVAGTQARIVPVSGASRPPGGNGPDGDGVVIDAHVLPRPPGVDESFLYDLVVAATLACHVGATPDGIASVLEGFTTGRHRREVIGRWNGVTWVNDSKATNPEAAATAVRAYPSVVLIAGGRNKDLDLAPVVAPGSLRFVVGIGEASDELRSLMNGERFEHAETMRDAIAIAAEVADPGDTVLLAPACASFDMFADYGARGDAFAHEARRMHEHVTGGV